jgi:hypothetical protein
MCLLARVGRCVGLQSLLQAELSAGLQLRRGYSWLPAFCYHTVLLCDLRHTPSELGKQARYVAPAANTSW